MIRNALLVAALGVCWGLNWPAVRLCLVEMPPWTLRAAGFAAATVLIFGGLAAFRVSPAVPRRHWGRLLLVGLLATVAYNLLTAFAQLSASTTRSAVLSYTMPIWAVIFARIALGEPFDRRRLAGLGLGALGLVALGLPLARSGQLTIGLLYAVMSGVVWAAGSVALKRFPIDASALVITAWQLALGAAVSTLGMLALEGWPDSLPQLAITWTAFVYHVIFAQVVALWLWFTILERMPAGIAAIGSLLVPGVGVIGATLILGETPTAADWLGLALIVAASASVLVRPPDRGAVATIR